MRKLSLQILLRATLVIIFIFSVEAVLATHNRAGEIVYSHISGHKYLIQVITYTAVGDGNANRPVLGINYDDGTGIDSIKRTSVETSFSGNAKINKNIYVTTHTFPGPGDYVLSMEDPNRNAGVLNIPNSVEQRFYIETLLKISPGKTNNSPNLRYPPIAVACLSYPFIYNPGAVDPDLDSLSYSLEICKGIGGNPINGYSYPSASKFFTIDPVTGTVTWDAPTAVGEYNIAIKIDEYRREFTGNGKVKIFHVGSILRDMQIEVVTGCSNRPPEIEQQQDYCVLAGENITFSVLATDTADGITRYNGDSVWMEAVGAPFDVNPIAVLSTVGIEPVTGLFSWNTSCSHVRKRQYTVNFRAHDNGTPPLSNYMVTNIMIVAPPVENFTAEPQNSSIELNWDKEICDQAVGYRLFRRLGASGFVPDSCETGVPDNLEYEMIFESEDNTVLSYTDNNNGEGLIPGEQYCYLIVAYFPDGAESYASEEVCAKLKKDVPILTNIDVRFTDATEGSIGLVWSKPTEHDQTIFPGPYKYRIWRAPNRNTQNLSLVDSTSSIDDTTYIDTNLNTIGTEYMYRIEMYDYSQASPRSMGNSVVGTSIFLESVSKDNELILVWNEKVPWRNKKYDIYKQNDTGTYDLVETTVEQIYRDTGLTNGREYCYYVESAGEYTLPSIAKPLLNRSQVHCARPVDLQAPCAPKLHLEVDDCENVRELLRENPDRCGNLGGNVPDRVDQIELQWTNPNETCDTTDDVVSYDIYYSSTYGGVYDLIKTNVPVQRNNYIHKINNTRAGCFYILAVDSFDNRSPLIDTVCTDNCLVYELPNVFTPNGDGHNDLFRPFPYCFVEEVDCTIYNRWGQPIFRTSDPDILWDGRNTTENTFAPEGVYFYTCKVVYTTVFGPREAEIKGTVHLLGAGKIPQN